jgi:hypothetical protein
LTCVIDILPACLQEGVRPGERGSGEFVACEPLGIIDRTPPETGADEEG